MSALRRVAALGDAAALQHTARKLPTTAARLVGHVGRAARRGALWYVTAAVLALFGRRGRRSAMYGVTGYVAASAVANGPAKWLAGRRRPGTIATAGLRKLGRRPRTSSFPSSHTAGAFAFATAAGTAWPATIPVALVAASGVGVDRVRRLRHYPSDVIAGAALGVVVAGGVGVALRALTARARDHDSSAHESSAPSTVSAPARDEYSSGVSSRSTSPSSATSTVP